MDDKIKEEKSLKEQISDVLTGYKRWAERTLKEKSLLKALSNGSPRTFFISKENTFSKGKMHINEGKIKKRNNGKKYTQKK